MFDSNTIRVSVVYVLPESVFQKSLLLPSGSSVADAIEQSGLADRFPESCGADMKCGIFSRATDPAAVLRDGDRVEVYRPLVMDPKQARRKRASRT